MSCASDAFPWLNTCLHPERTQQAWISAIQQEGQSRNPGATIAPFPSEDPAVGRGQVSVRLVITEKPSVARDLARVMDPGARPGKGCIEGTYVWSWALGHLGELAPPESYEPGLRGRWSLGLLPVIPGTWEVRPRNGTAVRGQLAVLRTLLGRAEEVVVATDAGREGELIWDYIRLLTGYRGSEQRLWLSETTPAAIRRAFATLIPPRLALRDAARSRARADWLVGMNATMALSARHGGTWSAGRVQTPTLALVVERERRIRAFVSEPYWTVEARFTLDGDEDPAGAAGMQSASGWYVGHWFAGSGPVLKAAKASGNGMVRRATGGTTTSPGEEASEVERTGEEEGGSGPGTPADERTRARNERIATREDAEVVARRVRGCAANVTHAERRQERETPPRLLNLNDLQRLANVRFGLTARQTLVAAQSLYEKRLLTYPRTDSRHVTPDVFATFPERLRAVSQVLPDLPRFTGNRPPPPGRRVVDASRVSDHHALLPTAEPARLDGLSPSERRIYELVARRFVAALLPDAVYAVTEVVTEVVSEGFDETQPDRFRSRSRELIEPGWRACEPATGSVPTEGSVGTEGLARVPGPEAVRVPTGRRRRGNVRGEDPDPWNPVPGPDGRVSRLRTGDQVRTQDTRVSEHTTEPPARYTDASLLYAMETAGRHVTDPELRDAMARNGLGTPATRAQILETLLARDYLEREKRILRPTPKGEALVALAPSSLTDPATTGAWERRLRQIEDGEDTAEGFLADMARVSQDLVRWIADQERAKLPEGERQAGRSRPSGIPKAGHGAGRTAGSRSRKPASPDRGRSRRSQTATIPAAVTDLPPCPNCGAPLLDRPKGYGCSRWGTKEGDCRFTLWKTVLGKSLTPRQALELLTRGKTSRSVGGLASRTGGTFAAVLRMDPSSGRIRFSTDASGSGPVPHGSGSGADRSGGGVAPPERRRAGSRRLPRNKAGSPPSARPPS